MQRTTIAVPRHVRDRLQEYGRKGMTYAEILEGMMDLLDPSEVAGLFRRFYARPMTRAEVRFWRSKTATEKIAIGEQMRQLALAMNPQGFRPPKRRR